MARDQLASRNGYGTTICRSWLLREGDRALASYQAENCRAEIEMEGRLL